MSDPGYRNNPGWCHWKFFNNDSASSHSLASELFLISIPSNIQQISDRFLTDNASYAFLLRPVRSPADSKRGGGWGKHHHQLSQQNIWNKTSHQGRYVETFSERQTHHLGLPETSSGSRSNSLNQRPRDSHHEKSFTKQVSSPHIGYPNGSKLSYVREYCNSQIWNMWFSPWIRI